MRLAVSMRWGVGAADRRTGYEVGWISVEPLAQLLTRTCPYCRSTNVRRSATHEGASALRLGLRSKYRCRECRKSFWVDRRLALYLFVGAIAATATVVAGAFALHALTASQVETQRAADGARFKELLDRAAGGDPTAEYEVYRMYSNGAREPTGPGEAQTWLQRSAEHGNADAQYELASAFRQGLDVLQDYERAFKWMQRAAEGGSSQAHYGLGVMYRDGIGTVADPVKAYVHLNVAAARGLPDAAVLRNAIMGKLTPEQLLAAQAEARRVDESLR
jgi:TPR repeat protein